MRNSTCYKLAGTKTFRRSSAKLISGHGGNLQNIAKDMRKMYIPDGYQKELENKCKYWLQTGDTSVFREEELVSLRVFLQTDQSGAEALIVAYDCDPKDYRQLFIHSVKPHVYVALKLFRDIWKRKAQEHGLSITQGEIDKLCETPIPQLKHNPNWRELALLISSSDDWPLTERYYYLAKQTVHSANYGIEWATFVMNILEKSGGKIVVSKENGKYFLEVYRGLFPEIPERCRRIQQQVEQTHIIYNMLGFPYQIIDYNVMGTTMKDLFAWGCQSTVGEITRIAFTNLQTHIEQEQKNWDIMADTHDSYLVQCPLLEVVECAKKMRELMNQPLISPIDGTKFNMKSETNIGYNWSPFKKQENPLGLQCPKWFAEAA